MIYKVKTTGEKRSDWVDKIREAWGTYGCGGVFSVSGVDWKAIWNEAMWVLIIDITDKPWLASWDMIEEKINEFFK